MTGYCLLPWKGLPLAGKGDPSQLSMPCLRKPDLLETQPRCGCVNWALAAGGPGSALRAQVAKALNTEDLKLELFTPLSWQSRPTPQLAFFDNSGPS